ncbi:hypothetical protein [Candidatus Albibeggiatoa sp. nov. BB20]|uniref:hypothetical protein n=1 Tax=Candidatus Albibeggiatoa sp. nov. BB20 TaxID=3162723 RepID=UPI0033657633
MKLYQFIFYLCSVTVLLCCSPQKVEQSTDASKDNLQKQQAAQSQSPIKPNQQQVPIKALNIMVLSEFPVQVNVAVVVEFKDNCTNVNDIYQNQRGDVFLIEMLETRQKQPQCKTQTILSEYIIPLDVKNLSSGHYTVYVNQKRGHFELLVDN